MNTPEMSRRSLLSTGAAGAAVLLSQRLQAADEAAPGLRGRVNHSVCKWCYPQVSLPDLCAAAGEIGLSSIELLGPADWPILKEHGLTCAMTTNPVVDGLGGIVKAFNRVEHHDKLVAAYEEWIPLAAKA